MASRKEEKGQLEVCCQAFWTEKSSGWLITLEALGPELCFQQNMTPTGFCDGSNDQRTKQIEPKIAPRDLALRYYKEKLFIGVSKTAGGGLILPVTASCPYQSAPKFLPAQNKNEPMIEMH